MIAQPLGLNASAHTNLFRIATPFWALETGDFARLKILSWDESTRRR
jgi:hypothetical protein